MTQDKKPILNYLQFFQNTYGISKLQFEKTLASESSNSSIEGRKKIFWKSGEQLLQNESSAKTLLERKHIFIIQNLFEPEVKSLFQLENWEVFKKMILALGLDFNEVQVWETNETEVPEIFHFLVECKEIKNIFLMLVSPAKENPFYYFSKAMVLETYSPLLFEEQESLKRIVWNHFKEFKSKNLSSGVV